MKSAFSRLLDQLAQRSAWQVVPVFLGASWAILEATSLFSERFGLPVWIFDLALVLLVAGGVGLVGLILLAASRTPSADADEHTDPAPPAPRRRAWQLGGLILLFAMATWGLVVTAWLAFLAGPSEDEMWATDEGMPTLIQMIGEESWEEAYRMARRIEAVAPGPELDSLWTVVGESVTLESAPPGATVTRRPYGDELAQPEVLGVTPLTVERFPRSPSVLDFDADGRRSVHRSGVALEFSDPVDLPPAGEIPDGFDPVPGELPPWLGGPEFAFRYISPNLSHAQEVLLGDFVLGATEVSNAAYKAFVDAGGYERPEYWTEPILDGGRVLSFEEAMGRFVDRTGRPGPSTWEISDYPDGAGSHPVGGVSWYEAMAYARFVGAELPTIYHWFRASAAWRSAWILPLSNMDGEGPRPVGSVEAVSQYGHRDMAGNVREWVYNRSRNGRFILGGGWEDPPYMFTVANSAPALDRSESNGFRLAHFRGDTTYLADARQDISPPTRDFYAEAPVSDEVFDSFRRMYAYDPIALNAELEEADTTDLWIRERVVIDAAYGGERLPIYLFLPRNVQEPLQTVVYLPGSGSTWLSSFEEYRTPHMEFLVKSGRAVAFPVLQSTFEREDGFVYRRQDPSNTYRDHVVQWVEDVGRTVDYLESREDVDGDRLAYFGYSWGGMLAPIYLAVEPRFKAAVLLVGGLSALPTQPEVDPFNYVTRVSLPVLMLNGEYDMIHPLEESARPMYELLATPDEDKRLVVSPVGHLVMYASMIGETLGWLDRYLGRVSVRTP